VVMLVVYILRQRRLIAASRLLIVSDCVA
jgi:hypothetical protein